MSINFGSLSKDLDEVLAPFSWNVDIHEQCAKVIEKWVPFSVSIANRVEGLLESRPPSKILDLACGRGDVAIVLAQRGYDVTALDYDPAMLAVAQELTRFKPNHVKWICADMRTITYKAEMDYVLLRDVIFSNFDSCADDRKLLRCIADALKPGGRCLFEVYNKEFALSYPVENMFVYDNTCNLFLAQGDYAYLPPVRLYALNEWNEMLNSLGLTIVGRDGWQWKNDPVPPPWRADFIVAQKALRK